MAAPLPVAFPEATEHKPSLLFCLMVLCQGREWARFINLPAWFVGVPLIRPWGCRLFAQWWEAVDERPGSRAYQL
ncbi:hypothetical protein GCM10027280_36940 [Micromonospora polyrhachis]